MPTIPDDDQWRCRYLVTHDQRCSLPGDQYGLCWLHNPKATPDHLQRAAQLAGILGFMWQLLRHFHGEGDGMTLRARIEANMADICEAVREEDESRIDELTKHVLGRVIPGFVPKVGITWNMVRTVGERIGNKEGLSGEAWIARLASGLPQHIRDSFRNTRWSASLADSR
jgi:hypothetical protein